ncbi:MAG: N-acetylmuramoyl-L-alanine amidase, partial [Pseudomonadota bacterium]
SILFEDNYQEMYGGFDPKSPEGNIYFRVMKNVFREESLRLAHKVEHQYKTRLERKSRGVKQAPFIVLWRSGMPAILNEIGFITHSDEEIFINSEIGQEYIATALFHAIRIKASKSLRFRPSSNLKTAAGC